MCARELPPGTRAQTCGANCRKAWSRRHEAVERAFAGALAELGTLRYLAKRYPDLAPQINTAVRRIQDECRDVLRIRPDEDEKARMSMLYDQTRKRDAG